jgi:hypothetical protein
MAALNGFHLNLQRAASSCRASPLVVFRRVTLPLLAVMRWSSSCGGGRYGSRARAGRRLGARDFRDNHFVPGVN